MKGQRKIAGMSQADHVNTAVYMEIGEITLLFPIEIS